jgi:DNA-binding PadR family transcriptional regulator
LTSHAKGAQYVAVRHVVNRRKSTAPTGNDDTSAGDFRPLSEPVLLMLVSLAEQPRHGYALIKDVEALTAGRVRLTTGTLFGAIRRLLEVSWIERIELEDVTRDKKAYRLTDAGRRQLDLELKRMKQLTRVAMRRLQMLEERQ